MQARTHWPGLILLLFLSPLAAELLSGSAPPAEFFTGWAVFLVAWYGLGAILCRELSIRWRSGLAGLFLLGAAFGILEEGILIKTFFDPNAIDLASLQSFGWWAGANWPWMVQLTLYHALMSITLPVLVVTSLWPEQRDRPWLSRRAILAVAGLLAVLALLGWFVLSPAGEWPPYWPGAGQFLGALVAIGLLAAAAWRIRRRPAASSLSRRWPLFLAGLGWGMWQVGAWILADVTQSTGLTIAWVVGVGLALLAFAYRRLWPLDRPALIGAGTLATGTWFFWSLLAFVQEADNANRPDDTSGMAFVGLVTLLLLGIYLIYLWRAWRELRS